MFMEIEVGVPLAFTVQQVGEILSCSRSQVYVLIKTGELDSTKIRGSRRVTQNQLLKYIRRIEST
jgi:excisionase family DNA binding protein